MKDRDLTGGSAIKYTSRINTSRGPKEDMDCSNFLGLGVRWKWAELYKELAPWS